MNLKQLTMFACPFCLALIFSQEGDISDEEWDALPVGTIEVRLKGKLRTVARIEDRETMEVTEATVSVGDTEIILDWQHSNDIHDELRWWSMPRHADANRVVQAELTGKLVFKPSKEASGTMNSLPGLIEESKVPVLLLDSLRVRLVNWRTGRPEGRQPDRPRVYREKVNDR